jgi:hypothetical protein
VISLTPLPFYPLLKRLGGPQIRSGQHGEAKILDPYRVSNSDPSAVQSIASRYTDRATAAVHYICSFPCECFGSDIGETDQVRRLYEDGNNFKKDVTEQSKLAQRALRKRVWVGWDETGVSGVGSGSKYRVYRCGGEILRFLGLLHNNFTFLSIY